MNTKNRTRAAAAGALVALLAAGAGVAAIGTGAIALGGSSAGAAIVTTRGTEITFTLDHAETQHAAYQAGYAETLCQDNGMSAAKACATSVKSCATDMATAGSPALVTMATLSGRKLSCAAA